MTDADLPQNPPVEDRRADCNDPTHGAACDCGATPDRDYERALDI